MIAVTMGDPAGIGPETLVKAWPELTGARMAYGDLAVLQAAAAQWAPNLTVSTQGSSDQPGHMRVVACSDLLSAPVMGQVDAACGQASFDALACAVSDAMAGQVQAIVTAPITKAAWHAAGIDYPGHTEYLAERNQREVIMVLANDDIAVALATVHCSMQQAIEQIRSGAVERALPLAIQAAQGLGFSQPRIAVAGLNPHAGEGGLFGDEELNHIGPAIDALGIPNVTGPWPGDTVFMRARQGEFDLVLAMTHDQGLIPVKYLGVERGVNFTAGLDFVRTSPDHGSAYDIAGTGQANHLALHYAYQQALRILSRRLAS